MARRGLDKEGRPQRVIFQPTKETDAKLQMLLDKNKDITISQLMNLIIMDVPDETKVIFRLEKSMPA